MIQKEIRNKMYALIYDFVRKKYDDQFVLEKSLRKDIKKIMDEYLLTGNIQRDTINVESSKNTSTYKNKNYKTLVWHADDIKKS